MQAPYWKPTFRVYSSNNRKFYKSKGRLHSTLILWKLFGGKLRTSCHIMTSARGQISLTCIYFQWSIRSITTTNTLNPGNVFQSGVDHQVLQITCDWYLALCIPHFLRKYVQSWVSGDVTAFYCVYEKTAWQNSFSMLFRNNKQCWESTVIYGHKSFLRYKACKDAYISWINRTSNNCTIGCICYFRCISDLSLANDILKYNFLYRCKHLGINI